MSKHTPGPWYIHDDHDDIVTDRDGLRLAVVIGDTPAQRSTDSRLIAAAPELLEALRKAIETTYSDSLFAEWSALIVKATGE